MIIEDLSPAHSPGMIGSQQVPNTPGAFLIHLESTTSGNDIQASSTPIEGVPEPSGYKPTQITEAVDRIPISQKRARETESNSVNDDTNSSTNDETNKKRPTRLSSPPSSMERILVDDVYPKGTHIVIKNPKRESRLLAAWIRRAPKLPDENYYLQDLTILLLLRTT